MKLFYWQFFYLIRMDYIGGLSGKYLYIKVLQEYSGNLRKASIRIHHRKFVLIFCLILSLFLPNQFFLCVFFLFSILFVTKFTLNFK